MALKFYYEWDDDYSGDNLVEIYDSEYTGSAIEVTGGSNPFVIEFPDNDVVDDPIIATGARLSFIYTGNESVIRGLFTSNIKRYKVLYYRNSSLFWSGYLNSEVYSEDYSSDGETLGIQLDILANDGLAILDRTFFYDDLPDEPTTTPLDIIKYSISKMDLGTEYLYYSSDIKIVHPDGTPEAVSDVFTQTLINTSNYLNEDGDRESCRTALESALKLYRLKLRKVGNDVFVYSVNQKAKDNTIYYTKAPLPSGSLILNYPEVNSTIPVLDNYYENSGQELSYKSSYNEQTIKIDTYKEKKALPNELSNEDKFIGDTTSIDYITSAKYQWREVKYDEHEDFFFILNNSSSSAMSYPINIVVDNDTHTNIATSGTSEFTASFDDIEYKLFTTMNGSQFSSLNAEIMMQSETTVPPIMVSEKKGKLTIKASCLFQVDKEEYLNSNTFPNNGNQGSALWCFLRSGDYFLKTNIVQWDTNDPLTTYLEFEWVEYIGATDTQGYTFPLLCSMTPDYGAVGTANIAGKWNTLFDYGSGKANSSIIEEELGDLFGQLTIPVPPNASNGEPFDLKFGVLDKMSYGYYTLYSDKDRVSLLPSNPSETVGNAFDCIYIKDLSIEFDDTTIGTENELVIEGDSSYKDKAPNIDLILGTSDGITSLQRGAYLIKVQSVTDPSQYSIVSPTWYGVNYFECDTFPFFKPEDRIVKTAVANRFSPIYRITCDLDYNYITENDKISFPDIPNTEFIFTGGELDCRSFILSGTWTQLNGD